MDMSLSAVPVVDLNSLVKRIANGSSVVIPPDYSGVAMAAVREIIRQRKRDLHLIGIPTGGFQADMLIGAGCVKILEAAACTLGEYGIPPRFSEAMKNGTLHMKDATCPAMHAALQAAEKGIPFMPLRGILGSDIERVRPDWKRINNPFADAEDPIMLIPAINADVTLFHAAKADRYGNVWVGIRRELMLMAHASKRAYVTVEEIVDGNLMDDEAVAAGTIPALYISAIAEVPKGGAPVGLAGCYGPDSQALGEYASMARTAEGFAEWLAKVDAETT